MAAASDTYRPNPIADLIALGGTRDRAQKGAMGIHRTMVESIGIRL